MWRPVIGAALASVLALSACNDTEPSSAPSPPVAPTPSSVTDEPGDGDGSPPDPVRQSGDEAESYFNFGGWGYWSTDGTVYAATRGCSWWDAGYGAHVYTLVDRDRGERLILSVGLDEGSIGAFYDVYDVTEDEYYASLSGGQELTPLLSEEGPYDLTDEGDGASRLRVELSDGSDLHVRVDPTRTEPDCPQPDFASATTSAERSG